MFFRYFIPVVLSLIGLALLAQGYRHWHQSYQLLQASVAVEGTIVRNAPYVTSRLGKSSSLVYFPEVRFRTQEGQTIQFVSEVTSRAEHYKPGDKVKVLYLKTNPQKARIGSFSALWALALIYATGGLLTLLFGAYFFYRAKQFGNPDSPLNKE